MLTGRSSWQQLLLLFNHERNEIQALALTTSDLVPAKRFGLLVRGFPKALTVCVISVRNEISFCSNGFPGQPPPPSEKTCNCSTRKCLLSYFLSSGPHMIFLCQARTVVILCSSLDDSCCPQVYIKKKRLCWILGYISRLCCVLWMFATPAKFPLHLSIIHS